MRWGCWGWGLAVVEGAHAGYWNRTPVQNSKDGENSEQESAFRSL